ncbi:MAG: hypothetical protein KA172_11155, partial [Paludibacter sp.]|nr:hypothetical protein [Paludibacter sp.]
MTAKRFLLYSFILLILGACAGTKKVAVAESPALSDSLQRGFSYFFYEGLRLKDAGFYDQAFESYRMSYAIDSLDAGL